MILAIDIGNTNIVIGCIKNDNVEFIARTATDKRKTVDQYSIQIKNILELHNVDISEIRGSIISSVVLPVLHAVRDAVYLVTGKQAVVVGPGIKTGLNIIMDNPATVGSDLIVNAVAGLKEYPVPMIIFDMGTATTISVVDKDRNYIGTSIMPGLRISLEALSSRTAQLPAISLETPKRVTGKNTIDSMRSGVIYGNAAMIDGMIDRVEEEIGQKATVIVTGGIARHVVPFCKKEIIYDENLLLKGLNIIYKKNRAEKA